jgi:PleD family two-component response regulator
LKSFVFAICHIEICLLTIARGGAKVPRIMIVDDASFMGLTIRNMLEKNNYEIVAEAADGL